MRKIQILKANHLSKSGVIIAADTVIALPIVDNNRKITKWNHKGIKKQISHFINT